MISFKKNTLYKGEYVNGKKHGLGEKQYSNGCKAKGEFENGKFREGTVINRGKNIEAKGKFNDKK